MSQQPQTVETDLRAGEVGIALLAAASFYFGGWLGIFPALWFLYAIAEANLPPEQRQKLLGPARATWRYALRGELPEGTPRWAARALGGYVPRAELPAPAIEEAAPAAPAPRAAAQTAGAPAPRPRWLQVVNDEPDQRPHMLILGPTRSGKTTLATAAMGDREGRAVVITPKINPSNWRGAEIVTLDDDGTYAPIGAALGAIEQEKRDRIRVLRNQGAAALEPLTIVFDEIGELAAFVPSAPEMMTQLSSIGAELKLRIIGIGTSDEALGIKRWKATRNNYVRIETDADRRAILDDGVRKIDVATRDVVPRAQVAQLRPWRGEVAIAHPVTGATTQLAPARAVASDAPRGQVVTMRAPAPSALRAASRDVAPAPEQFLAGLLADIPEAVRAEVPAISPQRAARLAQLLQASGYAFILNDITIHQPPAPLPAPPPATGRSRPRRRSPVKVKKMRERADEYRRVKAVIARGGSANDAQQTVGIKRERALGYARRAKAELGAPNGSQGGD